MLDVDLTPIIVCFAAACVAAVGIFALLYQSED
jgi:hypothetical protein